jgi:hypothetical protein
MFEKPTGFLIPRAHVTFLHINRMSSTNNGILTVISLEANELCALDVDAIYIHKNATYANCMQHGEAHQSERTK